MSKGKTSEFYLAMDIQNASILQQEAVNLKEEEYWILKAEGSVLAQVLVVPPISCLTLERSPKLSKSQSLNLQTRTENEHIS